MEYREFLSLTDDEVKEILNEICHPVEIKSITRDNEYYDVIICFVVTKWVSEDENGDEEEELIEDEIGLLYPYCSNSIVGTFICDAEDLLKYRQMCYAKGIIPEWIRNNPYIEEQ